MPINVYRPVRSGARHTEALAVKASNPGSHFSELVDLLRQIGPHDHLALIYDSKEEQLAAAIPAIRTGIARGEKCIYVADENTARDVIDALRDEGIDVGAVVESGRLTLATKQDTVRSEGHVVPGKMIRVWADAADAATAAGFSGLRVVAEMAWALGGDPGTERLIEFEAKLDDFVPDHPLVFVCQYDRRRFAPEVILNVIYTHPLVILGALVCRNPYYIPPQEFLGPRHAEMEIERLLGNLRDRKQAEERLQFQAHLLDTVEQSVIATDLAGKITYFNRHSEKLFGWLAAEALGRKIVDVIVPVALSGKAAAIVDQVLAGEAWSGKFMLQRRDGSTFTAQATGAPSRAAGGAIIGIIGIAHDITERLRAEEATLQLAAIVRSSDDAIIGTDLNGIITSWNRAAERIYGYAAGEILGGPIRRLIPTDRQEDQKKVLSRIRQGESVEHFETCGIGKGGEQIDISLTVSPIKNAAGDVVGASGVARDITQWKRTQQGSRESEARFRQLLNSNITGVVFWTVRGDILDANDLYLNMIGYTREDLRQGNLNWKNLTPPEYAWVDEKAVGELVATGTCAPYEKEYVRRDGRRVSILIGSALLEPQKQTGSSFVMDITDRKEAEKRLRFQAHLLDTVEQSVIATDLEGKVTYWNRYAEKLFGWTAAEVLGRKVLEVVVPVGLSRKAEEIIDRVLASEVWSGEFMLQRRDGSTFTAQVTDSPIRDAGGAIIGFVGIGHDITERLRAEAATLQLAAIVRSSDDAIIGTDLNGIVTSWNRGAERIFGYVASEIVGSPITRLIPTDRQEEEKQVLSRIRRGESVEHFESVEIGKGGEQIDISLTVSPIKNAAGDVVGASKVARDITGLKRAQQALRESEARFRQLLASNIVGVVFWNLQGNILDANDLFLNMVDYTREDLRQGNLTWKNLTPPEYARVVEKAIGELGTTGTCAPFEKQCIRKDGSRVSVLMGSAMLEAKQQTVSSFVMDITERKQAQEQREHYTHLLQILSRRLFEVQEEERRHLARELHDEIGQTLTAAKLNLKIIAPDVPPAAAGRLEDNIQLLDRLLRQVRQLSLDLRPPLLDDLGLVPALRWLVEQQAQRARLRVTFTANVEHLEVDPPIRTACFRVAQEAITNAIRHARAGTVAVELQAEPDRVWLVVHDDGVGFEIDAARLHAAGGASLGLLSMAERVSLLGGELEVRAAPGRGTEIRAWLPLAPPGPDVTP